MGKLYSRDLIHCYNFVNFDQRVKLIPLFDQQLSVIRIVAIVQ